MKNSLGTISQNGFLVQSRGVSFSKMRILGSFALVYINRGGGAYRLGDSNPLLCRAGDVLVVFPEIPHGYGPSPGGIWDEAYLVFEGPVFELWRQRGWLTENHPILSPQPQRPFAQRFSEIVKTNSRGNPADELRRICALQAWLADAISADTRESNERKSVLWPDWMIAGIRYMQNHPSASLEEIANTCKLSPENFRKKFKSISGVSVIRYRDGLMAGLAKKLIYEERLNNKEIADRLGICDEFHFSKRFRQIVGTPPSAFRRSLKFR